MLPLPAVTTADAAACAGAPQIAAEAPGNVCFDWRTGDRASSRRGFCRGRPCRRARLDNHRIVTNPMEPRGIVGLWDAEHGRYTAHVSAQSIHNTRDHAARALGVPPAAVRFVAPDVGGGFGAKNFVYPEHVLIPWAAKRVGRPVKWIASRSEVFLADHQARDHIAEAALALDADGRFLALRVDSTANVGAYLVSAGGVQTFQYVHLPGTVYRIPAVALQVAAVLTNTAPIGVTRGPGFAEAVNIIERLIDKAARAMRLRPRRTEAHQPGSGRGDADDQRLRQQGRQRRLSRDLRPRPRPAPMSPALPRGAARARRGGCCAVSALPITSRQPAARRAKMSTSASRPTAPWP